MMGERQLNAQHKYLVPKAKHRGKTMTVRKTVGTPSVFGSKAGTIAAAANSRRRQAAAWVQVHAEASCSCNTTVHRRMDRVSCYEHGTSSDVLDIEITKLEGASIVCAQTFLSNTFRNDS